MVFDAIITNAAPLWRGMVHAEQINITQKV